MSKKNNTTEPEASQAVIGQLSEEIAQERLTPNPFRPFSMDKDALRLALVSAQFALRATRQQTPPTSDKPTGLLVLVNGMEQAGKGTAVTQLRQWVDPRLLKVEATIGYCPLEFQPIWQAHTKAMPRHGDVMVYFGNWYADLLYNVMRMTTDDSDNKKGQKHEKVSKKHKYSVKRHDDNNKKSEDKKSEDKEYAVKDFPTGQWQAYLTQELTKLQAFEQDLAANQTKLLKCWFHVDIETLQSRLNDDEADPEFLYQIDWHDVAIVTKFNEIAAELLRQQGDWIVIEGHDKSQAANHFCHEVLNAMQTALQSSEVKGKQVRRAAKFDPVTVPKTLTHIDGDEIDKDKYHKALADKQSRLAKLLRARKGRHVVFAFEGMDAAGKGGAIKRLVAPLDPREYQIYNIGAPMLYELQHPYLWRFWTKLPNEQTDRISRIAIFDRTWYGRVLVERIEGFATDTEWQRAYDEINRFEADLVAAETIVIKYWLAIDKKEQFKRFEARDDTPYKQFKLTDDDWRNRDKWSEYVQSAADMLARTDTITAPWCVVATNDKRQARLDVLDHAIDQLSVLMTKD